MFSIASLLEDGATNELPMLQSTVSVLKDYVSSHTNSSPLAIVYNPENGVPYSGSNR